MSITNCSVHLTLVQFAERDALAEAEVAKAKATEAVAKAAAALQRTEALADKTAVTDVTDVEMSYAVNAATNTSAQPSKAAASKKRAVKPKLSAKEKRERNVCHATIMLPFVFQIKSKIINFSLTWKG